jgi:hypothetical protein
MDFRLKKRRAGHQGLNMGLYPGLYRADQPWEGRVFIAEDTFWFLEPGIKKHCTGCARYDHYGVTAITREEWLMILAEWEQLRADLDAALLTTDLVILRQVMKETRRLFVSEFNRNKVKLAKMIGELIVWLSAELVSHNQVSVLGI